MRRNQTRFLFLNVGHFLDHLFMLIFASAAALRLSAEWGLSYAALIPYAAPGFLAFGLFAIPAGWLADRWDRDGMMAIFFVGIGVSAMLAGLADSPLELAFCLTAVGIFAAIYHPVGLAMVVHGRTSTGVPLAINGVFGNMGVACAALLTGFLIDTWGWRSAFVVPGLAAAVCGVLYYLCICRTPGTERSSTPPGARETVTAAAVPRGTLLRVFGIVLFTTVMGSLVFQGTTFTLPKVFAERLTDIAGTATLVGWYAFIVFSLAALAQLVVGYLIDNHSIRSVFAAVAVLQAALFALMTNLTGAASLLTSVAFMLVVFGQIPINDVLVGRLARSDWRSRAYALRSVVAFTVTALTLPLIAWVHAKGGFAAMFGLLACAATLTFVAALLLPATDAVVRRPSTVAP